jgi:hypothetical protein
VQAHPRLQRLNGSTAQRLNGSTAQRLIRGAEFSDFARPESHSDAFVFHGGIAGFRAVATEFCGGARDVPNGVREFPRATTEPRGGNPDFRRTMPGFPRGIWGFRHGVAEFRDDIWEFRHGVPEVSRFAALSEFLILRAENVHFLSVSVKKQPKT